MKLIPEFKFKGESLSVKNKCIYRNLLRNKIKEKPLSETQLASDQASQIFLKRIKAYNLEFMVTDFFFALCTIIFVDNPGKMIIFLRLCYQYWRDTKKVLIGIEDFDQIFTHGTPTSDELREMWQSQKYFGRPSLTSDNLLDYPELWAPDAKDKLVDLKIDHGLMKKRK